ncbi:MULTISPECIES: lytic transglycosylase domain-containing protein [unclassified Halomonas]|uniref:lytic transglycosylase domain-containing protein n=1 Tax=unclassified Halomonas TaxID=2609666 RepID=UPI00209ED16E|nr:MULTISPECIES: lytic transglycosylase domain-containing protein [unclassified Halomonas]MCP1315023.1 lytic transglycosylase domain-containing protein [Halomonas sp. 707D7]MCP1325600.1 lytic transglycosylase domain-containing protein [Halomonas sp. 707D4]
MMRRLVQGAALGLALALSPGWAEPPHRPTFEAGGGVDHHHLRHFQARMHAPLSRFIASAEHREALLARLYQEAQLAGLPPALVLALIEVESAFKPDAVSSAGAVGLMQIMPFWVAELGLPLDDLTDPHRNLRYGCTILAHYLAVENGDFTRALARYNGSLGQTWYPERVLRAWQAHWR